jgi:hypothetical protein
LCRFNQERDGYAAKLGIIRGSSAKLFQIQHFFHAFELPSFDIRPPPSSQVTGVDTDMSNIDMDTDSLLMPLQLKDDDDDDDME